jgi:hypothetical protein
MRFAAGWVRHITNGVLHLGRKSFENPPAAGNCHERYIEERQRALLANITFSFS